MSSTAPSARPFGPYLIFRTTGTDPLGNLYRAGTLGQPRLRPFLHLRVFEGAVVDRAGLLRSMEAAVDLLEGIRGPSVAGGAILGAVDEVPFAGVEDVPGLTLAAVLGRRLPVAGVPPEHALLVTERVLAALEAAGPLEAVAGAPHGFLVPSFVLVSYDGETRVHGFGLGAGLLPALQFPRARSDFARYVAPEVLESGRPSTAGDIYSAAALLHEALTGRRPAPDAGEAEGVTLADGSPVPEEIRHLLRRGLAGDPARREKDLPAFRAAVGALAYGDRFAASTFNLAFWLQQQFQKSIQAERREREVEEQLAPVHPLPVGGRPAVRPAAAPAAVPPAPSLPKPVRPSAAPAREAGDIPARRPAAGPPGGGAPAAARTVADAPRRSPLGGVPVWLVGTGLAVLLAGGGFLAWKLAGGAAPAPVPTPAPTPMPTALPVTPTPIVAGKGDPLFAAAVQARLQEELKRREQQREKEAQLAQKKRQQEIDSAAEEARKAREAEDAARAASERSDRDEALRLAREAQEARRRAAEAAAAVKAAEGAVKEGDLLDVSQVDTEPVVLESVRPEVPVMARTRKVGGTVVLRVLVSESGRTESVEIVRDTTPKVGLAESSRAAVRKWTWTPATKDGKKVRTWATVRIPFVIQ